MLSHMKMQQYNLPQLQLYSISLYIMIYDQKDSLESPTECTHSLACNL
jgi:hypothetical protein